MTQTISSWTETSA